MSGGWTAERLRALYLETASVEATDNATSGGGGLKAKSGCLLLPNDLPAEAFAESP